MAPPHAFETFTAPTSAEYDRIAEDYQAKTARRDMSVDYVLFLRHLLAGPCDLLDLGCGPGRDLRHFASLGHRAVGVDGSARFAEMARAHSGCAVLQQDLLALDLPPAGYDGVFACASLFHVPPNALPRVLGTIWGTLRPGGVLFTLNPRGRDEQGWAGDRFCCYHRLSSWRRYLRAAGFVELAHGYRPRGLPRVQQQWLSCLWRKPG